MKYVQVDVKPSEKLNWHASGDVEIFRPGCGQDSVPPF